MPHINLTIETVTSSMAAVTVSGMDTGNPAEHKKIQFNIKKASSNTWITDEYVGGNSAQGQVVSNGSWTHEYRNLDSGTEYDVQVIVEELTYMGYFVEEDRDETYFTTTGGGPSGDPYYDFTHTNSSVTITVYDTNNEYIWYRCELRDGTKVFDSDDNGRTRNTTQLISGLQTGTEYWIRASYSSTSSGALTDILSADGNRRESFTTGGSPVADPYYTFTYDSNSVSIGVSNLSGYYIRYYCELDDGTKVFDSDDNGRTTQTQQTITGLQSNTLYWISVRYSETSTGSTTYIYSIDGNRWESFTTGGQSSGGGCMIYINGSWQHAKPYIYLNGSWQPATPYVYQNGQWTPCT